jgi:hypothetical protein
MSIGGLTDIGGKMWFSMVCKKIYGNLDMLSMACYLMFKLYTEFVGSNNTIHICFSFYRPFTIFIPVSDGVGRGPSVPNL